jgi:hypothetical protein
VQVQALALQEAQVAGFLSLLPYMQEQLPAQVQDLLGLLALLLWKRVRSPVPRPALPRVPLRQVAQVEVALVLLVLAQ